MKTQAHAKQTIFPNWHFPICSVGASALARPPPGALRSCTQFHIYQEQERTANASQHLRTITIFARRMMMMMYQIVVVEALSKSSSVHSGLLFWRWNERTSFRSISFILSAAALDLGLGELVRQPIQSLVEAVTLGRARRLDVPLENRTNVLKRGFCNPERSQD